MATGLRRAVFSARDLIVMDLNALVADREKAMVSREKRDGHRSREGDTL